MKFFTQFFFSAALLLSAAPMAGAQTASITGSVTAAGKALEFASVGIPGTPYGTYTDASGSYKIENIAAGTYKIVASSLGHGRKEKAVSLQEGQQIRLDFVLENGQATLEEVVVTGTLKEVNRLESPVPVEVYHPGFFRKNPSPSVFDALQNVNGVRPQLNCNVCNTGDIHINGLEGPYTMVLIDGMPIVSSLASVYGLSGIPTSMIERVEVVKGPASSLYGSEAVGGLINIITKNPLIAPLLSVDAFATSWQEYNIDLGTKIRVGEKATALTGLNYYNYNNIVDNNKDQFTDVTLQNRISLFQKWQFQRRENRLLSLAGRYFYEDRWGGDVRWTPQFRGGDSIYGESIYTSRWELTGRYQLPLKEKLLLSLSYNNHRQNSAYGITPYLARQDIAFTQLSWDKSVGKHDLLAGLALRYTFYDDNTTATQTTDLSNPQNRPDQSWLPGIFLQNEMDLAAAHKLLLGLRYDYNQVHGNIFTPRLAYKWKPHEHHLFRLNAGTGFRVVNLFTEEHASLTGAREVVVRNELKPERSYNLNLNYNKKWHRPAGNFMNLDATAFYTFFHNKIIPDYETDPNLIIYDNLQGYAVSTGISANLDLDFINGLNVTAGATLMDVFTREEGIKRRQMLTEHFTATWSVSYPIKTLKLNLDYTGNLYSPMRLPLLGELDPRNPHSPWWSLQNIQLTYKGFNNIEVYGGFKNLLNWTPNKSTPFLIARSHDPFDKKVDDAVDNPLGLSFDPTYMYAPNQGIRGFMGIRVNILD